MPAFDCLYCLYLNLSHASYSCDFYIRVPDVVGVDVMMITVKIIKFGTHQTIAIIVLKIEKFDVTLH